MTLTSYELIQHMKDQNDPRAMQVCACNFYFPSENAGTQYGTHGNMLCLFLMRLKLYEKLSSFLHITDKKGYLS